MHYRTCHRLVEHRSRYLRVRHPSLFLRPPCLRVWRIFSRIRPLTHSTVEGTFAAAAPQLWIRQGLNLLLIPSFRLVVPVTTFCLRHLLGHLYNQVFSGYLHTIQRGRTFSCFQSHNGQPFQRVGLTSSSLCSHIVRRIRRSRNRCRSLLSVPIFPSLPELPQKPHPEFSSAKRPKMWSGSEDRDA